MSLHKKNLFIIYFITLTFYAYFIRPADWNVASRFGLVKAIVEEKRLTIDSFHTGELETGDKAFVNGHYYSDKAIGVSLLGALVYLPIYLLTGHPLPTTLLIMLVTVMAISIPSAILAPLLYSMALKFAKEKTTALSIALCISLATPIFPYAGAFYGHSIAAVLAFSVFYLWMEINQFEVQLTPSRLFVSGLLIGLLVLTEYTTLIIAIALIGYMVGVVQSKKISWNWKTIGFFLLGGGIPLVLFISYNWVCFGSPFSVGYANESLPEFNSLHSEGLMGIGLPNFRTLLYITVNPMMGIFVQSPILFLCLGSFVIMQRETKLKLEFVVLLSMILTYFLAISGLKLWWGGDSFTIRHLIPILPFFVFFMIFLPQKYRLLYIGTGLISFFHMLVASAVTYHPLDEIIREILKQGFVFSWRTSLFYKEMIPKLLRNKLSLTWGQYLFGIESWYFNLAIPLLIALVLLLVFYILNRQEN